MKKFWYVICVAAASVLSLTSCDKTPDSPIPPTLGKITVSQEKIGVGQQIVLTAYDETPMAGNLYLIQPVWTVNGNRVLEDFTNYAYSNGLGKYTCYYTPNSEGSLNVELEVYMLFNDAPQGEAEQTVTATAQLEVFKCDARNSFWGDSVEITLHRETGLSSNPSGEGVYIGKGESSIRGISSLINSVDLIYTFKNEKLSEIKESFSVSSVHSQGARYVSGMFDVALRALETEYAGTGTRKAVTNTEDAAYLDVVNKYVAGDPLTDAEMTVLGEGMVRGFVRVEASMYTANTNILFTTNADPDNQSAAVIVTYSER